MCSQPGIPFPTPGLEDTARDPIPNSRMEDTAQDPFRTLQAPPESAAHPHALTAGNLLKHSQRDAVRLPTVDSGREKLVCHWNWAPRRCWGQNHWLHRVSTWRVTWEKSGQLLMLLTAVTLRPEACSTPEVFSLGEQINSVFYLVRFRMGFPSVLHAFRHWKSEFLYTEFSYKEASVLYPK